MMWAVETLTWCLTGPPGRWRYQEVEMLKNGLWPCRQLCMAPGH